MSENWKALFNFLVTFFTKEEVMVGLIIFSFFRPFTLNKFEEIVLRKEYSVRVVGNFLILLFIYIMILLIIKDIALHINIHNINIKKKDFKFIVISYEKHFWPVTIVFFIEFAYIMLVEIPKNQDDFYKLCHETHLWLPETKFTDEEKRFIQIYIPEIWHVCFFHLLCLTLILLDFDLSYFGYFLRESLIIE